MPTIDHVRALGIEIERQRKAKGFPTVKALADRTGVSTQHLGQIIKAYQHPKRGYTVPSDEVLEALSEALDVPLSRLHALLGRLPDIPFPVFDHPDTRFFAEEFDRLPRWGQKIVLDTLGAVRDAVEQVETTNPQQ